MYVKSKENVFWLEKYGAIYSYEKKIWGFNKLILFMILVLSSFKLSLRDIKSVSRHLPNLLLNLFDESAQCRFLTLSYTEQCFTRQHRLLYNNLPHSKRCYLHPLVGSCLET